MPKKKQLVRLAKPFATVDAAHAVVRAAEALDWDVQDTEKFLKRIQHVEYGLSAEIEFATILRWLGVCKFVHRLNEEKLSDESFTEFEVPDLLALFRHGDYRTSALIEVKTSEDLSLNFSKAYLDKLARYAAHLGKPLLMAWRPRPIGFWVLFDPLSIPVNGDRVEITFDHAICNDLMSYLAGDVTFCPKEGSGLRIIAERTGEKEPTENGFEAVFTITQAHFHGADGRQTDIPSSVTWLILSTAQYSEEVTDDRWVQSYLCEGMTRAQLVLRTAMSFATDADERIHWKAVHTDLDDVLSAQLLLDEAGRTFGTFMQYILYQQPQEVPAFLHDWKPPQAPHRKS